ncbi:NAD-dependent epimerase/dehydratase family protein [Bradyrhizobium sp. CCGUVB4N]|uniref:NAD-dependent epimerase/dehydratase family protein n=1 Tax=Bradyrhizobium sp. CCGUVB4N TaxID=2949631 RepID=UPI0020B30716|nr:NAD-dependent epimerase/dehydratase family protein [Bradyrhizobium sp. CCGUVB4N]MCP3384579.1 NAD-dependent epimerase/dehydratase family protein [Bradyrhizobium sp. CCGUVB4N]
MQDDSTGKCTECLVIGGSGLVGSYLVDHLARRGERVVAMSRALRETAGVRWIQADLRHADAPTDLNFTTLYCTASAILLADALPRLLTPSVRRVVAFSSTSVLTKQDTEVDEEREMIRSLTRAEEAVVAACERAHIDWTILRPTLIYAEGRDTNITPLSRLIRRFGFMLLVGGAPGLRQPVHAEDLAIGAIAAAASPAARNKFYALPGAETLTYREMIGRIFDGMRRPRRLISVPPWLWRTIFGAARPLFPTANVAMGLRMIKDMTFDARPATEDFGWKARSFHPVFDQGD